MIELKSVRTPTNGDRIHTMSENDKAVFLIGKCPICRQPDELAYEAEANTYRCDRCHVRFELQPVSFSWPHENDMSARGHENIGEVSQ